MAEKNETIYGRLLESVHISGYSMERACTGLEWLIDEDRWKEVGDGFEDINEFLETIDLSQFKIAVDRRKKLALRLDKMKATSRATAKALGVGKSTIGRDVGPNGPETEKSPRENQDLGPHGPALSTSGREVAQTAEKVIAKEQKKATRSEEIQKDREALAQSAEVIPVSDRWNIYHADFTEWQPDESYDFVITDPPYPKGYLPLWEKLGELSSRLLKTGGLVVAMSGQAYLDEVYRLLSKNLDYYWTASYLTPGQPTPLRQVNVNTTWKPLLIFGKGSYEGKIFGDVFRSDGNDKSFHDWGQSISGMEAIVKGFCLPGQRILDPFCGAGTTGAAAILHGCLFDGIDVDEESVNIARARLADYE